MRGLQTLLIILLSFNPGFTEYTEEDMFVRALEEWEIKQRKDTDYSLTHKYHDGCLFPTGMEYGNLMSESGYLLEHIAKYFMRKYGRYSPISRPLKSYKQKLHPDAPFLHPEPGSCPWVDYDCDPHQLYRSITGACNNLRYPIIGRAFTPLRRFLKAEYSDGISEFRKSKSNKPLPSARLVSLKVHQDINEIKINDVYTAAIMDFGQFVDHDLSLTGTAKLTVGEKKMNPDCGENFCETDLDECKPITIPENDPTFGTDRCLKFIRSQECPNIKCTLGPRQHANQITSYIDASNVYGSTKQQADALRNMDRNGTLKSTVTAGYHHLPIGNMDQSCKNFNEDKPSKMCFNAGDIRSNEQPGLISFHTIFMRYHNVLVERLAALNPKWSGDKLYEEVRKMMGAIMQITIYNEYLPVILGKDHLEKYHLKLESSMKNYYGYSSDVDPSIRTEFSTAAFRFGHGQIRDKLFTNDTGTWYTKLFFQAMTTKDIGQGNVLQSQINTGLKDTSRTLSKVFTNHMFTHIHPLGPGTDLASLNIQRGRDHGIPGYNKYRKFCDLEVAYSFDGLKDMSQKAREALADVYEHVDDIDLFTGGMSENLVPGSQVGPVFQCLLGRQFKLLRKGDRFWHENKGQFTMRQLTALRKITLASIICETTSIQELQPEIFKKPMREIFQDLSDAVEYARENGQDTESYEYLWDVNYNAPVACDEHLKLDLTQWAESAP